MVGLCRARCSTAQEVLCALQIGAGATVSPRLRSVAEALVSAQPPGYSMRIPKPLFILLSLFAATVRGDMTRSGNLTTETWRAVDGPFTVTATVTIPSGVTVTI